MIYSQLRKIMIWAELTVPLEENVIDAAIRKTWRYLELAITLRSKGWTVNPFTIEVGSIGWVADSTISVTWGSTINSQSGSRSKPRSLHPGPPS